MCKTLKKPIFAPRCSGLPATSRRVTTSIPILTFSRFPLVLAVALVSQSSGFNVGCDAGTCQRIPLVRDRLRTFLNGRPFRILFYVGN